MNANTYQEETRRTRAAGRRQWAAQALVGLISEVGEVAGLFEKSSFQGHQISKLAVRKELGDILWYFAEMCDAFGFTIEDVMDENINKLKTRFPEKFSTFDSLARVDTKADSFAAAKEAPVQVTLDLGASQNDATNERSFDSGRSRNHPRSAKK